MRHRRRSGGIILAHQQRWRSRPRAAAAKAAAARVAALELGSWAAALIAQHRLGLFHRSWRRRINHRGGSAWRSHRQRIAKWRLVGSRGGISLAYNRRRVALGAQSLNVVIAQTRRRLGVMARSA